MRDDRSELGEIKRVVNTLIQGIDSLDDCAVVIGATNHDKLLDKAVWRRFPYKAVFPIPELELRALLWNYFLFKDEDRNGFSDFFAVISEGLTGADIEEISLAERRSTFLQNRLPNYVNVARAIINSKQGHPVLPPLEEITTEERKHLSLLLAERYKQRPALIGNILGVTRQTVSKYLRSDNDG